MGPPSTNATAAPERKQRCAHSDPDNSEMGASPPIILEQKQLAGIVDEAVNKALSRVEQLFRSQKAELEAKEAVAEKALKSRMKKEKKERAEERTQLVEMIREMALELEDRDPEIDEPVILKDAVGRKFVFPFEACKTWRGFEDLVKQAFMHVDVIGPQVHDGFYDILSPKGFLVLPSVWDDLVEPGWEVSMQMWPMLEAWKYEPPPPPPQPAPPPVEVVGMRGRFEDRGARFNQQSCKGQRLGDSFEGGNERQSRLIHKRPLEASVGETVSGSNVTDRKVAEDVSLEEDQSGEWDVVDD